MFYDAVQLANSCLDEVVDTSIFKTGRLPRYPRSPMGIILRPSPTSPLSQSDLVPWHNSDPPQCLQSDFHAGVHHRLPSQSFACRFQLRRFSAAAIRRCSAVPMRGVSMCNASRAIWPIVTLLVPFK